MLILASASPRRHEILLAAGLPHIVRIPHVVEERLADEQPVDFVKRLAEEKAGAVPCSAEDVVLGADTIVCLGAEVFGKPSNDEEAARMLRRLSGRGHWVYTGICLKSQRGLIVDVAATKVWFGDLTGQEIAEYVASGEPRDKAGAYGIQGLASKFVKSIEGCYHNVVGLPISLVYRHLKAL